MRKEKAIVQIMMVVMMIGMILSKNTKVVAGELTSTSGSCGDSCSYQFNKDTGELVITGSGEIDTFIFSDANNIVDVKIEEGITGLGESVFRKCAGLKSITIPEGVTNIGGWAFHNCVGLTSITIPEGVTSIGDSAFYGCASLTSITIPEGVTSIGNFAFSGCAGLTSITIPEGVTSIGDSAFSGCAGLTSITIPEGVTSIGDSAFSGCAGLTSITIPEGVTSIGDGVFYGCAGLTSITLPDSVANVGRNVFPSYEDFIIYCSDELLKNESFKDEYKCYWCITPSTKKIEEQAGKNTKVIIDAETFTLTFGGDGKVYSDYQLPSYLQYHIKNVVIDSEEAYALKDFIKLENIRITEKCKKLQTFYGCINLTSILIPESVQNYGYWTFKDCSNLTSVNIPNGVTMIGAYTFYGCNKLTDITIPEGVTIVDSIAFSNCTSLETITIPESVETIADDAFEHCDKMTIHCVEGSAAEKYAKDNDIPYESVKSTKPAPTDQTDGNSDSSGNNTSNTNGQSNNNQNQPIDIIPSNVDQKPADQTNQGTENDTLQNNSVTKFNIKKNKTYKKNKKVTISDNDGIKSVKLNGKTIKVKKGIKKISFKLSKYKKMLKSKKKANTLTVTDIKGVKSSVKFKVK